jgi:hypothetical protein
MEVLMYRLASTIAAVAAFGLGPAMAQTGDRIGIASVAKNDVVGTLGSAQRPLKIGDVVSQNERIRTGADSTAQLLFRDETTLSMGPDSVVVLDKAVYDPRTRTGEVTMRAVTGAFRFVSGSSPSNNYKIQTHSGTIGVRGTILDVEVIGQLILAITREGSAEYCQSPGNCIMINAGQYIVLSGGVATPPKPINDHACGMTGLSGGQSKCAAKILGSILNLADQGTNRLGADFQPGNFAGGPPPGDLAPGSGPGGPGGPGTGPGGCSTFLPNGNCYPGVGAPGRGGTPPGLR